MVTFFAVITAHATSQLFSGEKSPIFEMRKEGPYHVNGQFLKSDNFLTEIEPNKINTETEVQLLGM